MLWSPVALMMVIIILKSPKQDWIPTHRRDNWIPNRCKWTLAFPALGFMLGLLLYTDIRNESGFAMFSNMRSDAIRNNHFFMKKISVMNDGNDQGVAILETDNERVGLFMGEGRRRYSSRLTWFELRRLVSDEEGDITITYQRDGDEAVTVSRELDPGDPVFEPLSPFESRLRLFTTIPTNMDECPCRH